MEILLIEDNPGDARLVKELLAEADGGPYHVHWAETLLAGLNQLTDNHFDVAILDLSLPDSNGLHTFTTVRTHAPRLPLVLMTGLDNDALALRAVESGAQDYLVKGTLTGEALARTLRYAVLRHNKQVRSDETPDAKLVGVVGTKGGVGTTTFATHLAFEWRRQAGNRVLLMDLDENSGSSAFILRSNSGYSILDASTALHRLDAALWKGMVWTRDGFEFIQPPGHVRLGDRLGSERLRHVLRFLRSTYEVIVIDLCRFNALTIGILSEIQELFVITSTHVQTLYEAKRVITAAKSMGVASAHLHLVLNRVNRNPLIAPAEVERALGSKVEFQLPFCEHDLEEAYADGRLLRDNGAFHGVITRVVTSLTGAPAKVAEPRHRTLFGYSFAR